MKVVDRFWMAVLLLVMQGMTAWAADIKGLVLDKQTKEPLIGATVMTGSQGTVTDIDGKFVLEGLKKGTHQLTIQYVAYKTVTLSVATGGPELVVELEADRQTLDEVTVTGIRRNNTEAALLAQAKESKLVVNTISAQEIRKTQDNNASEVIRRVPGVSLIEDKFVMVRGLSQRYNNVWINGGAVPSSEADSRAFSFDIIPSSQIDNLIIVKSPSPEYPADFSGGFILINTRDIPAENRLALSVGGNWNDAAVFQDFRYSEGSKTDFLGFDRIFRPFSGGFKSVLAEANGRGTASLLNNGFNNDWRVQNRKPWGDLKLGAEWSHRWERAGAQWGLVGSLNYTNEYRAYTDMINNLFGVYDQANDRSNYLRHSTDNQYNNNVRLGAMLNLAYLSASGDDKIEFKHIVNQLATNRYTDRTGINAQSDNEVGAEYYYRSRTTYNGQLTGKHTRQQDEIQWSASYSYANRRMPDRRRYTIDDALEQGTMMLTAGNEINREFTKLDEQIVSAQVGDTHQFQFGSFEPTVRVGAYGEYRSRDYRTREFIYTWDMNQNNLPAGFRKMEMTELLSNSDYFGADKLYLIEQQAMRNNYQGKNTLAAGYVAATLPWGNWQLYAGLRYEFDQMELITNSRDDVESPQSRFYRYHDFFPSINTTYQLNEQQQLRLSYGKSVNRAEFREVSPSVYYDFDLASHVQGNVDLQSCYVHNVDLRYEYYPTRGEQITLAAFYKRFQNPIEWTYTVAGGTSLVYSYENAQSADNFGLELDIRKDLSFLGLDHFSWSFNGSLIRSRVHFPEGSRNENRPMQGQSPYLINTGLFYRLDPQQLQVSLLYNRIGKRIIGVGRSEGSSGSEENARVPDSYEMPRDVIDLTFSKRFGEHIELKANIRDLLAQKVSYKQFAEVISADGQTREVQQITRQYKPGRNIGLSAVVHF
ncbi:MAG: TonB-dependent receptor [Parabacteroides sp.]|nr:TonB-dependent receptor [bacterium]MDY4103602.1 TonB-dependent receptor [Parabacteroides sp.]